MKAKKLIEVAMPIKEISAESLRDKAIRHGHISTLHLWWARRPLPACRAVVFASLVPDPLDPNCPQAFKDAVEDILCTGIAKNIYAPYPDIPYTVIFDPMEDNLRNRLLMFIGKFSEKCQANMIAGKSTPPKEQLQDGCLIKWESKNDETVLNRARKLIWVAYNSELYPEETYSKLEEEFDASWENIKNLETLFYSIPNRHLTEDDLKSPTYFTKCSLIAAIEHFQSFMPSVFDPFAGGGAIPLEAARLGCRSYGNDINPVAHIIEKGSVEFPQKFGKPITFSRDEFIKIYGEEGLNLLDIKGYQFMGEEVTIPNLLSFDVEFHICRIIKRTENKIGHLYPKTDKGLTPIAYYWAHVAKCSNPSCGAEVPLLRQFYLANTSKKKLFLKPIIKGKEINFEIQSGTYQFKDWCYRGNMTCPCCGSLNEIGSIKEQFKNGTTSQRILAIIADTEKGKEYYLPSKEILDVNINSIDDSNRPTEKMPTEYTQAFPICTWGYKEWGQLHNNRQIFFLNNLVKSYKEEFENPSSDYDKALMTMIALFVDRVMIINTSAGRWNNKRETLEHPYSKQAMPMTLDYPESNPFSDKSGSMSNQLEWICRYIESESSNCFSAITNNTSSGEKEQFKEHSIYAVVTDPPYYDAIGYADISDIFYAWMKRTIGTIYPLNFSTPQTPKTDECTAIVHHHNNSILEARKHFETKLWKIFESINSQVTDIVSIMFAHQTTAAWTTLCNSILGAKMNIKGSWALDTEMASRAMQLHGDSLESSVTVACTPSERKGYGSYKKVKQAIQNKVSEEVRILYQLGFRGADLLTACFGKAVGEFGNYEYVEKADGSEVTVAELLSLARTSAFTALIRDFASDDYTKFYIGWLQLNGFSDCKYDDATQFTRTATQIDIKDIFDHNILIREDGTRTQHLGSYKERIKYSLQIPPDQVPLIDKVHHAMYYWADENKSMLLKLIEAYGQDSNNEFWRVFTVLKELLPDGDDKNQVVALLDNSEVLIKASKEATPTTVQGTFDFGE